MTAKKTTKKEALAFKMNEFVVYPAHGVGQITAVETKEIAGTKMELFVISFEKDKMTLRVPTFKALAIGMRGLSTPETVENAMTTLRGKARVKRTMWSRRAAEYEAKINSGDLISIAEVVRDLYRGDGQPEQSYSERQLYEAAIDRLAREVGAVGNIDEDQAVSQLEAVLTKQATAAAAKAAAAAEAAAAAAAAEAANETGAEL